MIFRILFFFFFFTACVHHHSVGPVRVQFKSKEGVALKDLPIAVELWGHKTKVICFSMHGAFDFFCKDKGNALHRAYIFTDSSGFITIDESIYEILPAQYGPYSMRVFAAIGSMCKGKRLKHVYTDSPYATSHDGWGNCIETKEKETFTKLPSEITCRVQLSSEEITTYIEKNPFDPGVCKSGYYHNKY